MKATAIKREPKAEQLWMLVSTSGRGRPWLMSHLIARTRKELIRQYNERGVTKVGLPDWVKAVKVQVVPREVLVPVVNALSIAASVARRHDGPQSKYASQANALIHRVQGFKEPR